MKLIKIETTKGEIVYLNPESIASFYFAENSQTTDICMNNTIIYIIDGNVTSKLAKLITSVSNNGLLHLE